MSTRAPIGLACPLPAERATVSEWLTQAGYSPVAMPDLSRLEEQLRATPVQAMIADVSLLPRESDASGLMRRLGSNRPLLVIGDTNHLPRGVRNDVSSIERPLDRDTLLLSVALALAEGRPARRFARRQIDPVPASAQGVAVTVRETSEYGVGLELSTAKPNVLPPVFSLRVPSFGVHVVVRRAWLAPLSPQVMRCGGTVEGNLPDADRPWAEFAREAPSRPAALAARF
ncbi:MAG: hypothetical protein R2712_16850 [Vicinamibacterales bacterium]